MQYQVWIDLDYQGGMPRQENAGSFNTLAEAQAFTAAALTQRYSDTWERTGEQQYGIKGNFTYNVAFLREAYTPLEAAILERDRLKVALREAEAEVARLRMEGLRKIVAKRGEELYGKEENHD